MAQETYATAFTAQEYSIILRALEHYELLQKKGAISIILQRDENNKFQCDHATLNCIETIADKIDNRLSRGAITL